MAPTDARAILPDSVSRLAGLWTIEDVAQLPRPWVRRFAIVLRAPDTTVAPEWPHRGHPTLTGERDDSVYIEVRGTAMVIGACSTACVDGWSSTYRLLARRGDKLWGTWTYSGGIEMTIDRHGNVVPPPVGYFCMTRGA